MLQTIVQTRYNNILILHNCKPVFTLWSNLAKRIKTREIICNPKGQYLLYSLQAYEFVRCASLDGSVYALVNIRIWLMHIPAGPGTGGQHFTGPPPPPQILHCMHDLKFTFNWYRSKMNTFQKMFQIQHFKILQIYVFPSFIFF